MQVSCTGFTASLKVLMPVFNQTVQFRLRTNSPLYFAPMIHLNLVVTMLQMAKSGQVLILHSIFLTMNS